MTITRFTELADAYGGDLSRWPVDEIAAAAALLKTSDAARAAIDEALMLDQLLDAAVDETVEQSAADRVVAFLDAADLDAVPQHGAKAVPSIRRFTRPQVGFLAAMAVAGFVVGLTGLVPTRSAQTEVAQVTSVQQTQSPAAQLIFARSPYESLGL